MTTPGAPTTRASSTFPGQRYDFVVDLVAGDRIAVRTDVTCGVRFQVLDPGGVELDAGEPCFSPFEPVLEAPSAGTCTVRVELTAPYDSSSYQLHVDVAG